MRVGDLRQSDDRRVDSLAGLIRSSVMPNTRLIHLSTIFLCALSAGGCALFQRGNGGSNTNVSSSVSINSTRDLATLQRHEYDVHAVAQGKARTASLFFLTFPFGNHKTKEEVVETAYYNAMNDTPNCDTLQTPRASVKRVIIPLILFNITIKTAEVRGRCVKLKKLDELDTPQPSSAEARAPVPAPPS